jgi:hypothetical protein
MHSGLLCEAFLGYQASGIINLKTALSPAASSHAPTLA